MMASDNPDLSEFRDEGGKLLMWHGFADQLIPGATIDYYDAVTNAMSNGNYNKTQKFARLFMAPGVEHCGGGVGPQPENLLGALVNWVEHGKAPNVILASKALQAGAGRKRGRCARTPPLRNGRAREARTTPRTSSAAGWKARTARSSVGSGRSLARHYGSCKSGAP